MDCLVPVRRIVAGAGIVLGLALAGGATAQNTVWMEGRAIQAQGIETTGTVQLLCGKQPGFYSMPTAKAQVRLSIMPSSAEAPAELTLESDAQGVQVLSAPRVPGVKMTVKALDAHSIIAKFEAEGDATALIRADVSSTDEMVTNTISLMQMEPAITVEGPNDIRVIQMYGPEGFKTRDEQAAMLISSLDNVVPVWVVIGSRERTREEITGSKERPTAVRRMVVNPIPEDRPAGS